MRKFRGFYLRPLTLTVEVSEERVDEILRDQMIEDRESQEAEDAIWNEVYNLLDQAAANYKKKYGIEIEPVLDEDAEEIF